VAIGSSYRFFAPTSPGLEEQLREELAELDVVGEALRGGVSWRGGISSLWRVHHRSRLTESVRVRLAGFRAQNFTELVAGFSRLPWHAYLTANKPVRFDVTCKRSRLYHSGAVEERARAAVAARLSACRAPETGEAGFAEVHVRIESDRVETSVEATGELLHRRGYRLDVARASLRETLAAALVRLLERSSQGSEDQPIWDPCCGAGTLLIEAVLRRLPGSVCGHRRFSFEDWPIHEPEAYARLLAELNPESPVEPGLKVLGHDLDPRVLEAARRNAERAGVAAHCSFSNADFRTALHQVPVGCRVLGNLPYGKRLGAPEQAGRLFSALDRLLSLRSDLRPALILHHGPLPRRPKCRWRAACSFVNGGIPVTAWLTAD